MSLHNCCPAAVDTGGRTGKEPRLNGPSTPRLIGTAGIRNRSHTELSPQGNFVLKRLANPGMCPQTAYTHTRNRRLSRESGGVR